ncbi:hypothetical protein RUND412_000064 [Rhizina undulata]
MTTFKAAAIQLSIRPLSPTSNFADAKAHIQTAAAHGCRLAVLPEYILTGWVPEDPKFADLAEDKTYLEKFCEVAKACKINLVPGTFVEKHKEGDVDVLYNTAHFISETGEVLVPEAFRQLITQGAQIIIIPSYWTRLDATSTMLARNPTSEEVFLSSAIVCRAFENTACVIFANAGGEAEQGFAGQSQIAMPGLGAIAKADGPEEQMVVGEIELEVLDEAEECYRVREDLGREGFHYGVKS